MKFCLIVAGTAIIGSCQHIESGNSLGKKTIEHIKSLGLLDDGEKIVRYYSNYTKEKAGNFFTDKRIAHYWLDDNDPAESDTSFAFYQDILSIDTVYSIPDTFVPYMTITKKDNSAFKVFIEGSPKEVKEFFEGAMDLWKKTGN
ncbi:MAG: hypothetical protein ACHQFX_07940 [Chitinophagales bacterium]